jgi:hypothetical protein
MVALTLWVLASLPFVQAAAGQSRLRKVNMHEVEVDLENSLSDLLGGASPSASKRLAAIQANIWQTFQALPKNAAGRLAPAAVRYIVHSYFAKEHGWLIKGLEPHGHVQTNVTQVHDINVLQDKVPVIVEHLLEARQVDRGLALSDVVAMVAVLEQLMFDESVTLLEAAYTLNGLSTDVEIEEVQLHKVLQSYVVLFGQGSKADLADADYHHALVKRRRAEVEAFEQDIVLNFEYARRHRVNPFRPSKYTFQVTAEIMEVVAQLYGKWQNAECRAMKAHLSELDSEGSGRVPLGLFYAQPEGGPYQFSESSEYLRQIGALDESSSASSPQVRIANYIAGPSNCIASSSYYSVCCLSDCDHIFNELEHQVLAPATSPERLLALVGNISETQLPEGLPEKLHAIAAQHGGEVPLHGRLFAQWLHFAFPHECPYPSVLENATALTASQWLSGSESKASAEEREQHLGAPICGRDGCADSNFNIDELWSEYEVLPVHEPTSSPTVTAAGIARTLVQVAAILVALRSAIAAWSAGASSFGGPSKKNDDVGHRRKMTIADYATSFGGASKRNDDYRLPF